ncbi:50S ribosomal protein L30 [Bacteroidetes/Chlorobi group bacterium ChocPot_Mid]|jgi:large subunit ribosomal protein L30|nr:MAG: 50S ribosomal protein L30 [Bacteroidetes/Chlorobi group bacterium ChocPot_Mid]
MAKLKITQVKSIIDRTETQKQTIRAMKLGRPNYSVIMPDNPQTRGMIEKVKHLIKVEEVND